ncbi:uncharacterized protein LOC143281080 [Babylonia areolata]|uniref:uncharacterized protein LOC143281080 n=1 Tax=Babylonia areolata TaxID=304850 RepID=UPI003FD65212
MTHFSEEQIAEFQEAFSLFDKDADGYVTNEEVGVAIRALGGTLAESELQQLVQDVGKENNGLVDFPEFLTLMARTVGTKVADSDEDSDVMLETLTLLDRDKTGFISTDLLRHVLTTLGEQLTSEEVEELLKEADKEETGKVDYREFVKMITS